MKPAYMLAEIGVNHGGSLDLALEMIKTASIAGASGVKFQCYEADKLAAQHSPAYWDTDKESERTQYSLFKRLEQNDLDFYKPLIEACKKYHLDFVVTCFDPDLIDTFDPYVPFHKISSSDITNLPLIDHIIEKNKPIVLSTGASTIDEIDYTVNHIIKNTKIHLTVLHCVLNYPCEIDNANISMVSTLKDHFADQNISIGYSCHVPVPEGFDCILAAITSGAVFIEKHFTTSRIKAGNDHYHAMTAEDLLELRIREKKLIKLLGEGIPDLKSQEMARLHARRGLYAAKAIPAGTRLEGHHIAILRPTNSLLPIHIDNVLGKSTIVDLIKGDSLSMEVIE
ncbi:MULTISPECIES: N-acetylneuraminate synthase family protein [unclassified Prochlorococcus]|uniref:N-acetylneuraminate synthase family protein n=1 Tax=unclassified Prochlorococcus TaxID=2627481 RepID=UPI00068E1B4A|nr:MULTISPECIES: N-acetylneuraminate synthase family protein [unclassified Prochlorococcus]